MAARTKATSFQSKSSPFASKERESIVQLSQAWKAAAQPTGQGRGAVDTSGKANPMKVTSSEQSSGQMSLSKSLQSTSGIDWTNQTEADMWFAAEAGVSSTAAAQTVESCQEQSPIGKKNRSWLPQWHLQGLHNRGRKAVITTCMESLRALISCMPMGAAGASNSELALVADAMVAVAACNACQKYMNYVPECLFQATAAQLRALATQGRTEHGSAPGERVPEGRNEELQSASDSSEVSRKFISVAHEMASWLWVSLQCVQADSRKVGEFLDQPGPESKEELVFPGLASGKGTAHALMLQCLLRLRARQPTGPDTLDSECGMEHMPLQGTVSYSQIDSPVRAADSSSGEQPAHARGADHMGPEKDPTAVDNEPSVHASNGVNFWPSIVGARDVELPSQILQNVPALLQDMVLCSAEACAAAYMEDVRTGNVPNSELRSQATDLDGYVHTDTPFKLGWTSQAAMIQVPALLDARLGTTRELERFRNHLAIATAVRQNYGSVRDMYEDRFTLQGVRDGYKLVSRSLFIRRTHELNALQGWKARLSTAMEFGDVVAPIFVRILQRLSRLLSWLLVSMVGGGLGLIYKGIRQSMSGKSSRGVGWDLRGRRRRRGQNDDQEMEPSLDFL